MFNLLDSRRALSVTERQGYILRVRTLSRSVARAYYDERKSLGFPLADESLRVDPDVISGAAPGAAPDETVEGGKGS